MKREGSGALSGAEGVRWRAWERESGGLGGDDGGCGGPETEDSGPLGEVGDRAGVCRALVRGFQAESRLHLGSGSSPALSGVVKLHALEDDRNET